MASSTTAPGTLVPSPRTTGTQQHGLPYFWLLVAIVVGGTALLATWVVSQPDTDIRSDSATTSVSGGLSPRAADNRDAQILERSGTSSAPAVSPNAADFRDAQTGVQRATSPGPVSPNTIDRRDGFQQSSSSSFPRSPNAADYRDRREPQ